MRRWHRYRRRLVARTLRVPEAFLVLTSREVRDAVEGSHL